MNQRVTHFSRPRCRPSPPSLCRAADQTAPLAERREPLADYGFVCACDKCSAEELAEELLPAAAT